MQQAEKKNPLIDEHGRLIHKLRLQLTDTCNFRCFYCMPRQFKFLPSSQLLKANEFIEICSALVGLGIDEIRISGGEPTLRADLKEIVRGLSNLPVERLGITTNGYFLADKIAFLSQTKCRNINISLDSLNKKRFRMITKSDSFDTVYRAILKAKEKGLRVKVNVVALRGLNDDEVFDYIDFSAKHKIEVRFLELMKIGPCCCKHNGLFVPAQELIQRIEEREELIPQSVNNDSTAFNFKTSSGGKIGFIASESQPFCNFCSRLRLSATGGLRACLMSDAGISLRGRNKSEYPAILRSVIAMKPVERIEYIRQPMYQIGG
ncbi:MAG: GTP 3',8-cyclase MoaA [Candidatus Omnitrophica bacterium]|nr:GTP 3',8-cyclase MoaA [Candidatus Omnitrophota bacterium]